MTRPSDALHATLLRLALHEEMDPALLDWPALVALAVREGMLLRLETWFTSRGLTPPPAFDEPLARARARECEFTALAARVSAFCDLRDIPYAFTKLAQGAPDVGRDLDVLLDARCTVNIPMPASAIEVDFQRGRLGRLGEHDRFAAQVLERRVQEPSAYGGRALPCAEDRILLLALSRVYGRPRVRLSDVWAVARAFASDAIDIDRLIEYARSAGLLPGLACFLDYVDQIGRRLLGDSLLSANLRARLPGGPWGRVALRDGGFEGSTSRVAPYLYAQLLTTRVLERVRP